MKSANRNSILTFICLLSGLFSMYGATASDADDLTALLQRFLGAAHTEAAHRVFWADDLVYTSSNGTRFGKAEILAGFAGVEPSDAPPAVAYSAEDIDIRNFGNAAVVAFRLVAVPSDGTGVLEYFNTGVFLKRAGNWQIVAWQATLIPGVADGID